MTENNGKAKIKGKVIGITLGLVIVTIVMICISNFHGDLNLSTSKAKSTKEYNTIKQVKNGTSMELSFPPFIKDSDSVSATNSYDTLIEIVPSDKSYALKVSPFVDVWADPLTLYDYVSDDYSYICNISDSIYNNLIFFRIRYNMEGLDKCTVVNWVNNNVAYGIILGNIYEQDEVFKMFSIDKSKLKEYEVKLLSDAVTDESDSETAASEALTDGTTTEGKETISTEDIELDESSYIINGNYALQFPKCKTALGVSDTNGIAYVTLNKQIVFAIVYNDLDIQGGFLGGGKEKQFKFGDQDAVFRYAKENPFDSGTDEYDDYELLVKSLDNIISTACVLDISDEANTNKHEYKPVLIG